MPAHPRLRSLVLLPVLALAILVGASAVAPTGAFAATRAQKVAHAADIAIHQIGDPYRYGAAGPNAFDCSGLMQYSFGRAGIRIPRTAAAQAHAARHIAKHSLRRGDLMFFTNGGGVYHAAMFLRWKHGHAVMIDAPHSGTRVRREVPWTSSWFAATLR